MMDPEQYPIKTIAKKTHTKEKENIVNIKFLVISFIPVLSRFYHRFI